MHTGPGLVRTCHAHATHPALPLFSFSHTCTHNTHTLSLSHSFSLPPPHLAAARKASGLASKAAPDPRHWGAARGRGGREALEVEAEQVRRRPHLEALVSATRAAALVARHALAFVQLLRLSKQPEASRRDKDARARTRERKQKKRG